MREHTLTSSNNIQLCQKNKNHICNVKNRQNNTGCPICRESHLEKRFRNILLKNSITFLSQHRIHNRPYDFFIHKHYNILIELQGEQHFREVLHFHRKRDAFAKRLTIDTEKCITALKGGFSFLSISYLCMSGLQGILDNFLFEEENSKQILHFYITEKSYLSFIVDNNTVKRNNIRPGGTHSSGPLDRTGIRINSNSKLQIYQTYMEQINALIKGKVDTPVLTRCRICDEFYYPQYIGYHYKTKRHRDNRKERYIELENEYENLFAVDEDGNPIVVSEK